MVTLYDYELSAECYRVRLMLSMLGVAHETVPVDVYPGEEHRSDWFRALSPMGTLPVLVTDTQTLAGSLQILEYLAEADDSSGMWLPGASRGEVEHWLGTAQLLSETAGSARWVVATDYSDDLAGAQAEAHQLFRELDEHLWFGEKQGRDWLIAGDHPTIADIAVFPDVVLSEEGGVSRQDYPAIRRWLDRVRRIPGFVVMSGVFPAAPPFTRE